MAGDVSALEGGFYLGSESNRGLKARPVKVGRIVHDGDTLTFGGVTLTANLTPGHTRGCTSWGFEVHEGVKTYRALLFCSATVAAGANPFIECVPALHRAAGSGFRARPGRATGGGQAER